MDIFFSYARNDVVRIEPIVAALEDEGFSVWWDRKVLPGTPGFDDEIENQLNASGCAIVAWSQASRVSNWVREEAHLARAQEKLVPILIERVSPPLGLRRVQAEDFVQWRGSRDADGWQRLMLQIESLVGRKSRGHSPIETAPPTGRSLPLASIAVALVIGTAAAGVLIEGGLRGAGRTAAILTSL